MELNSTVYELPQQQIDAIYVPNNSSNEHKLAAAQQRLRFLKEQLSSFERQLRQMEKKNAQQPETTMENEVSASSAASAPPANLPSTTSVSSPALPSAQGQPVRRKRGRPPKNRDLNGPQLNPPKQPPKPRTKRTTSTSGSAAISAEDWKAIQAAADDDPELFADLAFFQERELERQQEAIDESDADFQVRLLLLRNTPKYNTVFDAIATCEKIQANSCSRIV